MGGLKEIYIERDFTPMPANYWDVNESKQAKAESRQEGVAIYALWSCAPVISLKGAAMLLKEKVHELSILVDL